MKTRNIMVKAPHPSPPPQGGREFQAYQYRSNAITTSDLRPPRNDNYIVSLRGGFSAGRRVSEANPARLVPVGRYSAGTPNNPIRPKGASQSQGW